MNILCKQDSYLSNGTVDIYETMVKHWLNPNLDVIEGGHVWWRPRLSEKGILYYYSKLRLTRISKHKDTVNPSSSEETDFLRKSGIIKTNPRLQQLKDHLSKDFIALTATIQGISSKEEGYIKYSHDSQSKSYARRGTNSISESTNAKMSPKSGETDEEQGQMSKIFSTPKHIPSWKTNKTHQAKLKPSNLIASLDHEKECKELRHGIIQIMVKSLTGKTLSIEINSTDMVLDLKNKLEDKEGIPISQQRLVMGGKHLFNELTIGNCNIQEGSTVYLLLCIRGGTSQPRPKPLQEAGTKTPSRSLNPRKRELSATTYNSLLSGNPPFPNPN